MIRWLFVRGRRLMIFLLGICVFSGCDTKKKEGDGKTSPTFTMWGGVEEISQMRGWIKNLKINIPI